MSIQNIFLVKNKINNILLQIKDVLMNVIIMNIILIQYVILYVLILNIKMEKNLLKIVKIMKMKI